MTDLFERYGLTGIVNVSGTETVRGAALVCREVIEAFARLVPHSVEMAELQSVASELIACAYGCVTGYRAAGIAVAIAACYDRARPSVPPHRQRCREPRLAQDPRSVGGPAAARSGR